MISAADQVFFSGSMQAAAALLGLLFVSVTVNPERTMGAGAPEERRVAAESAFTALSDAFFVSMAGATSDLNFGVVLLIVGIAALSQSLYVGWRLFPRRHGVRSAIRRLALVVVALAIYGVQISDAIRLLRVPSPDAPVGDEILVLVTLYAFALARSWELIGGRPSILSHHSTLNVEANRDPAAAAPPAEPVVLTSTKDVRALTDTSHREESRKQPGRW